MTARSACNGVVLIGRTRVRQSAHRAELLLILAAVLLALFLLGIWACRARSGDVPVVMAQVTVKQGDTLWALASRHGDPKQYILKRVDALARINDLGTSSVLYEGQTLIVPVGNSESDLYKGERYASEQIAD